MTERRRFNIALRLCCMIASVAVLAGCIAEDTTDCAGKYTLTVRAYDNSGNQLGSEVVKDVHVFIFDRDSRFTGKMKTTVNQSIPLGVLPESGVQIIAWANLDGGTQKWSDPEPGDLLEDCFVELTPHERVPFDMELPEELVQSPADLFRGEIEIVPEVRGGDRELPVYRETGSMTITVRNLKTYTGYNDNDFSVVVHNTPSAIGFNDILTGNEVAYLPQGSFLENSGREEYYVAPFNLLPQSVLSVDIYHGTRRIASASRDVEGNPISVEKGKQTNVLIDLRASVYVSISLGEWGGIPTWKEF